MFSGFLKQSTAATFRIGPFVDATDGDTEENALTVSAGDVYLSKSGAAIAAKNDATACTADPAGLGYYDCTLNATDTNTVGRLDLIVHEAGARHVVHTFYVLEEAIYDALFAASSAAFDANQRVDVGNWLGVAVGSVVDTDKVPVSIQHSSSSARDSIADSVLARSVDNVENTATARTLCGIVIQQTHSAISGNQLVLYKSDDTTFATITITPSTTTSFVQGIG